MILDIGSTLQNGKYEIIRFISSGGFGNTYEGIHVMLRGRVAIKEFFPADYCNREPGTHRMMVATMSKVDYVDHLRAKFIEEAQAISGFNHPGIVKVYDVFEENCTAYYVMDYIDGCSLQDMLVRYDRPLTEPQAIKYIRQAAEAMKYVHDHGRLHLDIKPANIMVGSDDNALLIDFGVSKNFNVETGEAQKSMLVGLTPGYSSIEQMSNDVSRFTPATDVYSLAATLYAVLTGEVPISAALIVGGEAQKPLPSTISEATRRAVMAGMNVMSKDRPQTMAEFLSLLPTLDELAVPAGDEDSTHFIDVTPISADSSEPIYDAEIQAPQPPQEPPHHDESETRPLDIPPVHVHDGSETRPVSGADINPEYAPYMGGGYEPRPQDKEDNDDDKGHTVAIDGGGQPPVPPAPEVFNRETAEPEPKPRKGMSKGVLVALIAVVVLLVGAIAYFLLSPAPTPKVEGLAYNSSDGTISYNGNVYRMVNIAGGTFKMGANKGDKGSSSNEAPQHDVTLTDYRIGATEVPQWLWNAVMGTENNPSYFPGDNRPVEQVNFTDAEGFIDKLNEVTGGKFRLPTEAEWEYAARGGATNTFAGADSVAAVGWVLENSLRKTYDVGSLQANGYGLYDMTGNVAEWVSDYFGLYRHGAQTNPKGPSTSAHGDHIVRGGSYDDNSINARVTTRTVKGEGVSTSQIGLRLASDK